MSDTEKNIVSPCSNEDCSFFARYNLKHGIPFCVDPMKSRLRLAEVCVFCVHFTRFDILKVKEGE